MKQIKSMLAAALCVVALTSAQSTRAEDKETKTAKSYPLKTCVVSDEKLDDHGKPYVFTHEGQEVQLCCKSCLKDFNKEPAKYMKKIETGSKNKK